MLVSLVRGNRIIRASLVRAKPGRVGLSLSRKRPCLYCQNKHNEGSALETAGSVGREKVEENAPFEENLTFGEDNRLTTVLYPSPENTQYSLFDSPHADVRVWVIGAWVPMEAVCTEPGITVVFGGREHRIGIKYF